jgi:hypothetical protein
MRRLRWTPLIISFVLFAATSLLPVGAQEFNPAATTLQSTFSYQGYVEQGGIPVTAVCDFQFSLFDALTAGVQIGSTLTRANVSVTGGIFVVQLDFGVTAFAGADRYVAISVRCPAGGGAYTALTPRQAITPAPYATYATRAPWAGLQGVPAGFADGVDNTGVGWSLTGNAGTNPATQFIGTTNDVALEFRVNNLRIMRFEPNATSPTIIGGFSDNNVSAGVFGATISGGGTSGNTNRVTDDYGTVGGGVNNQAGDNTGGLETAAYATVGGGNGNTAMMNATVGGGYNNTASADAATVGGGQENTASGLRSTVGGGINNTASGNESTIGGGFGNSATAANATIGGGGRSDPGNDATGNRVTDDYGTVGGGGNNQAGDNAGTTTDNPYATVGGGSNNTANGESSTVGGGFSNDASADSATIGGGYENTANGESSTVGGGFSNDASADSATIGGGYENTANGESSTVGGGWLNVAGNTATVGGGFNNQATVARATIAGGSDNLINGAGEDATIGGGYDNTATADSATVAGGWLNTASGTAAFVGGGYSNEASGVDSMVVGGFENTASGNYSFAAGRRAQADDFGAFVWGDATDTNIFSPGGNTFSVRAAGGLWFGTNSSPTIPSGRFINTSTGAFLTTGGAWTNASDVNAKANFAEIDPQAVLETLMAIPVTTWNYIAEGDAVRRMGPMAQDFYAAYGLGGDDTSISTIDAQGVAFAAIQGLYQTMQDENARLTAENTDLVTRVTTLETENADLAARLVRVEAVVTGGASAGVSPIAVILLIGAGAAGIMIQRRKGQLT